MAPARPAPTLAEAESLGLMTTFRGAVLPEHCDAHGYMLTRHYMGRVSDAIPNLIAQTRGEDRSTGTTGGAALEYRFVYRMPAGEGDLLILKSGLRSVSSKTYIWCHWLFDAQSGECFATAEAVAVAMDLTTRKAIEIPSAMRAQLESLVVPGLSA
jgi:acyl-CoA thioester hydrolase